MAEKKNFSQKQTVKTRLTSRSRKTKRISQPLDVKVLDQKYPGNPDQREIVTGSGETLGRLRGGVGPQQPGSPFRTIEPTPGV